MHNVPGCSPCVQKERWRRRSEATFNTWLATKQPQTGWTKNKLPLDLIGEASDCIQPGARIFVFLLLGNHKVSRAATGKVTLVSAGNPSILLMRTKCPAYFVMTAGIMGRLCFLCSERKRCCSVNPYRCPCFQHVPHWVYQKGNKFIMQCQGFVQFVLYDDRYIKVKSSTSFATPTHKKADTSSDTPECVSGEANKLLDINKLWHMSQCATIHIRNLKLQSDWRCFESPGTRCSLSASLGSLQWRSMKPFRFYFF